MRVVIFGIGLYYSLRKKNIEKKAEIVAFIDNNPEVWGNTKDGVGIFSPDVIEQFQYDRVILMSRKSSEMKKQLLALGVDRKKIRYYEEFYAEISRGKLEFYFNENSIYKCKKKILIAMPLLGFHGVPTVAIHTAKILKERGYHVVIVVGDKDEKVMEEVLKKEIDVIVYGKIYQFEPCDLFWIKNFDFVIINSYDLLNFAIEVNKIKPCFLWLHESKFIYQDMFERFSDITKPELRKLDVFAASDIAQKNFNEYYPDIDVTILKCGLEDQYLDCLSNKSNKKLIFAIIGYVCEIKAQDIFGKAVELLNDKDKENVEFWIIGSIGESGFQRKVKAVAQKESTIKILGELDRDKMKKIYSEIDVVVSPSRQEVGPLVISEGMMYGKVCITSEKTGMAPYIKEGENGFICKTRDAKNLCDIFKWIIHHRENLKQMGKNARRTYEEHFTIDKFGDRLEHIINS